jgi:hypothetical protein
MPETTPLAFDRENKTVRVPANVADDLAIRFSYHTPTADQLPKYAELRAVASGFAHLVAALVPPGREQALAITKIEEAVMFANAGIARQPAKEARGLPTAHRPGQG